MRTRWSNLYLAASLILPNVAEASADPRPATVVDTIEKLVAQSDALFAEEPAPAIALEAAPPAAIEEVEAEAPIDEDKPKIALPACEGGVPAAFTVAAISPPLARSDAYRRPEKETLASITASLQTLAGGDEALAAEHASLAGYELCRDADEDVVLWRPAIAGEGAPLIALRLGDARPLILEAPHSFSDEGTQDQAVMIFEALGARAMIVAGTHRCADPDPSGCDGETSVCDGVPRPYRESDMAHNDHSVFQLAHEILSHHFAEDLVISLHGMNADGVILSDGTTLPTSPESFVAQLSVALAENFPDQPVTVCNAWGSASTTEHLCGTTNVQGRSLNGALGEACIKPASGSSGRFLHFEQSKVIRAETARVIAALDRIVKGRPPSEPLTP